MDKAAKGTCKNCFRYFLEDIIPEGDEAGNAAPPAEHARFVESFTTGCKRNVFCKQLQTFALSFNVGCFSWAIKGQ